MSEYAWDGKDIRTRKAETCFREGVNQTRPVVDRRRDGNYDERSQGSAACGISERR